MHNNEYEDFEILNTGNNKLLEAISYFNDNYDSNTITKIKKSGFLCNVNSNSEIISYIMELMSSDNNKVLFRKSNKSNNMLTNLWISKVHKKAKEIFIQNCNIKYKKLTKIDLKEIAECSYLEESIEVIQKHLYTKYGIILVIVPNIEGMKTDAVTFLLTNNIPVIGMSLRLKRYDYFWFTLLHELSHIHLHLFDAKAPIIDDDTFGEEVSLSEENEIEIEANALARDSLIPRRTWTKCKAKKYQKDENGLIDFSNKYKIHKSIIAGFIRFEQKNYTIYNKFLTNII